MKTPQQLLQQTLEVGECLLPDASPGGRTPYPTVFVHGLLGWGARDALYRAVPYWGLAAGDVLGYLNACGYDCRAASVGIISSAWDRACELYAELTGGTADYGIAHAQRFGISAFKGVYDFRLDQFGIRRDPDEPLTTAALRMLAQNPLPAGDNAFDDLRPAGARALNARVETLPDTWYFSIPCCRTLPRLLTHDQKPDTAMTPLLWPFSTAMGRDGAGIPRDWLPNDGLVNTISARYPGGAPHADFAPGQTPVRGVWQVLPVEHLDHLAAIGGVMNNGVVRTRLFYRRVMALLDAAAAADANS